MPISQSSWIPKIEAYLIARDRNLAENEAGNTISVKGLCKGLTLSLFEYIFYDVIVPYYEWKSVGATFELALKLEEKVEDFFSEIETIINTPDEEIEGKLDIPFFERFITRLFFFQKLTQDNSYGLQLSLSESFQHVQNKNCKWILPQIESKQTIMTKIQNLDHYLEQLLPSRRLICVSFPQHATFLMNTGKGYIYYDANMDEKKFTYCRNKYELIVTLCLTDALLRNEHQKTKYDFTQVQKDFIEYYKSIMENEDCTSEIRAWLDNTPGGTAIQVGYLKQCLVKMKKFTLNVCQFDFKKEDEFLNNEPGVAYISFHDGCLYYQVLDETTQRVYKDEIFNDGMDPDIFKLFQEAIVTKDLSQLNEDAKLAMTQLIIQNQFFTECSDINFYIPHFINFSLEYYTHPEEKKHIYPDFTAFLPENQNIIEFLSNKDHFDMTLLERVVLLGDIEGLKNWLNLLEDTKISDNNKNKIINAIGSAGRTLLSLAIVFNQIDIVKILLDANVDCNKLDKDGLSPLDIAFHKKNVTLTMLLLQYGADPNIQNKYGIPFIVRLLAGKNNDFFCALLEQGGKLNPDYLTNTLLGYTVKLQNFSMMKHLLLLGADPNLCIKGGKTPIHQAISGDNFNFAWELVQAGAVVNKELLNDNSISNETKNKFKIFLNNSQLFKEANMARLVGLLFKIPNSPFWFSSRQESNISLKIYHTLSSPGHSDDSPDEIAELLLKQTRSLKLSDSFEDKITFVLQVLLPSKMLEMKPISNNIIQDNRRVFSS